jgi:hypothetical protein
VLGLTKSDISYKGSMDGENVDIHLPLNRISAITANYGMDFEVTDERNVYRFIFHNGLYVLKWSHAVELLSEMRNSDHVN